MFGQQGGQGGGGMGGGGGFNYMQMAALIGDYASKNNAATGYAAAGGDEDSNVYREGAQKAQDFGAGGAAAVLGYFAGKKDKKLRRRAKRKIEQTRATTRSIYQKGISQQEAMQRLATQQALGGFDTAKSAAQLSASSAKRSALEREQQVSGRLSQHLTDRGIGSTSVGTNLSRGVAADTSRNLAGIDEELGQYFGQLAMGRAAIESGGTMALSDIGNQRTNFDIQDANFWSGYDWNRLGRLNARSAGGVRSTGDSIPKQMFG